MSTSSVSRLELKPDADTTGAVRMANSRRWWYWALLALIVVAVGIGWLLATSDVAAAAGQQVEILAKKHHHQKQITLDEVVSNLRLWLVGILAAVATLFLTIGGLRYLAAGGDPGQVEKAKTALKSAAIGYGLALLAPVLITLIKQLVGS